MSNTPRDIAGSNLIDPDQFEEWCRTMRPSYPHLIAEDFTISNWHVSEVLRIFHVQHSQLCVAVMKNVLNSLPSNKDWLDPEDESTVKKLVKILERKAR